MKKAILSVCWIFVGWSIFLVNPINAQTIDFDPADNCTCLDNEMDLNVGQFTTTFNITGSDALETWSLSAISNIYDPTILNPLSPVVFTTAWSGMSDGAGDFSFTFMHRDREAFSFVLTGSSGTVFNIPVDIDFDYSQCGYPRLDIDGSAFACLDRNYLYCVDDYSTSASFMWTLGSGGVIVGAVDQPCVMIDWDDFTGANEGPHTLTVSSASTLGCNEEETIEVILQESSPMACNNRVNITIGESCMYEVQADDILEGQQYSTDSYEIILTDTEQDTIIQGNILDGVYIGIPINISVRHICSGISCWGSLLLEDKFIPDLLCMNDITVSCDDDNDPAGVGLPVPAILLPSDTTRLDDSCWEISGFDMCGPAILCFSDTLCFQDCEDDFAAILKRKWTIEDMSGRMTMCVDTISVEHPDPEDIVFPPHYKKLFGTELLCKDTTWIPLPDSGYPSPESTGTPTGGGLTCGLYHLTYTDLDYGPCSDGAFKITRRWRVFDHCNEVDSVHVQIIEIFDEDAPVIECPDTLNVYTTYHLNCKANIDTLPSPTIINECSAYSYTIGHRPHVHGDTTAATDVDYVDIHTDGTFGLDRIPVGQWTITYFVTDACGNDTFCNMLLNIVDNHPPDAVCDLYTTIGLNDQGIAWADVHAFDDGSHDFCSEDVTLQIRRMEGDTLCGHQTEWTDKLQFCCEDVGKTIMVALLVTDASGSTNTCMVEAEVQDNNPPLILDCPNDTVIDCQAWIYELDLDNYGVPTYDFVCGRTQKDTSIYNISECGVGTIKRIFYGLDHYGEQTECSYTIYVGGDDLLTYDKIDWPDNIEFKGCTGAGTDPDNLPLINSRPRISDTICTEVVMSYEDIRFNYVDGVCVKILRNWKVVDWCQFDPNNHLVGRWSHSQVIKVTNTSAPVISCDDKITDGNPAGNCMIQLDVIGEAVDDCTPSDQLIWTYRVDINNDDVIDFEGFGNDASDLYPYGTHIIYWSAMDGCGNVDSCAQAIYVEDNKAPTPYCIGELVTVIMSTDEVTIWAKDFGLGSYDNCTQENDLMYSFSEDPFDKQRTFTCDDLDGNRADTFALDIYVTDKKGNYDFCQVKMIVQDNQNHCNTEPLFIAISGNVYREDYEMIEDAQVDVNSSNPVLPDLKMTDDEGQYAFRDLPMYETYSISAQKESDYAQGVTTLDIVLIQRHILGLGDLDSPYKVIAADANNSGSVSAIDIIELRKLILGITDGLNQNSSWKFVDAKYEFPNPTNPFPYDQTMVYSQLETDMYGVDFIGVKIGDVNNSAKINSATSLEGRSSKVDYFTTDDQAFQKDETIEMNLDVDIENSIEGFQFSLEYDIDLLEFESLSSETIDIDESNLNVAESTEGLIAVSWNGEALKSSDEKGIVSIRFKTKKSGVLSESVMITSSKIDAEIYAFDGEVFEESMLFLQFRNDKINANRLILKQNVPNPFSTSTDIEFYLPKAGDVKLSVFDMAGKLLFSTTQNFERGENSIHLKNEDLDAYGILHYQIETKDQIANKKMILIK